MSEEEESVANFKEGPLLKMKKGLAGAKYWKKNWVYVDGTNLYQWQSSTKPSKGEDPKYTCNLMECKVEESQARKYAFKITDKSGQESMTFAADDFDSYDSWLKMLLGEINGNEQHAVESRNDDVSVVSEDFQQFTSDKIADFFYEHDISTEPRCPAITEKDLRKLLHLVDPALNANSTMSLIFHDLHIRTTAVKGSHTISSITYEEFKQWWNENGVLLTTAAAGGDSKVTKVANYSHVDDADCILFAGLQQLSPVNVEFLCKARVPRQSTYTGDFAAPQDTTQEQQHQEQDWNERYQSALETASMSQSFSLMSDDIEGQKLLWNNYRRLSVRDVEDEEQDENMTVAEEIVPAAPRYSLDDAVKTCLSLASLKGHFNRAALSGAKTLIDEYSLPVYMKTHKKVAAATTTSNGDHGVSAITSNASSECQSSVEDLYEMNGLLYRIVAVAATPADRDPNTARCRQLASEDDSAYKRVTAEQRATSASMNAIESLYTDYQTSTNWRVAGTTRKEKFKHFQRPCTLLSTLVDYGGFCVQVQGGTHIMEQFTLLHGFASELPPLPPALEGDLDALAASNSSAESTVPPPLPTQPDHLFINALPAYRSTLSQLANALNLKMSRRLLNVTTASLFESDDRIDSVHVEMLAATLQAHKGVDDRLYMLNFDGIFPPDLPREHSFDVLSRHLRPEFVASCRSSGPLPCGEVFAISQVEGEEEDDDDEERRTAQLSVVSACSGLYSQTLPQVARSLDMLLDLLPCDSHELTQYLHTRGVSCRHLGLLYTLCRTPCVRQLLLTECIARACKKLLRQSLRHIARKCRAETLMAEHRGRSKDSDFIEYMDLAHSRRRQAVLDMFNAVFFYPLSSQQQTSVGGVQSSPSEEFWRGALLQTITQKFGVDLKSTLLGDGDGGNSKHLMAILHLPQLFLALQYHANCRFKDNSYSSVFSGQQRGSVLFTLDDLVECCIPCCDGQTSQSLLQIPGELGRLAAGAESFLLRGLYGEAIHAFQLRLAFLSALSPATTGSGGHTHTVLALRQEAVTADTLYKLALSQYCGRQYSEAGMTVRQDYLRFHSQYLASSGRMFTLLMKVEQRCGRVDRVRSFFDAAQCVYTYALSVHHPVISMHMCALADLYKSEALRSGHGGQKHAKAMLVLARSLSGKALGEHHLVSASYGCKLATLLMSEGQYREATLLLSSSLTVFDSFNTTDTESEGAEYCGRLDWETTACLHALTESFARCEELDLAIHSGFRCVELCARVLQKNPMSVTSKALHRTHMSCLLILSDLFVQKSELDSAFGLLQEAWTSLRSTTQVVIAQNGSGQALAALACRIMELMISTLPMQTRSLFVSVAEETLLSLESDTIDPSQWDQARDAICSALWNQKPAEYLALVIQGIQQQEINGKRAAKHRGVTTSFSLQAALITRLIKSPQEFSQQLISF